RTKRACKHTSLRDNSTRSPALPARVLRMRLPTILAFLALVAACSGGEPQPVTPAEPVATSGTAPALSANAPSAAAPDNTKTPGRRAPQAPVALEEYFKIRRTPAFSRSSLPMVSFSYDEKLVAFASDEGGRIDVWVKPTAGGGQPTQITHADGF